MIGCIQIIHYPNISQNMKLRFGEVMTPFGVAVIVMHDAAIVEWWFTSWEKAQEELKRRWRGARWYDDSQAIETLIDEIFCPERTIDLKLRLLGTDFQFVVWEALLAIAWGQTVSYAQVAERLGKPTAVRAVASAIGKNPVSYLIPCHRVIHANGTLGQYRWGSELKAELLQAECSSPMHLYPFGQKKDN